MKGRAIVSLMHFLSAFYKTLRCCLVVLMPVLMLAGCDGSTSAPATLTAVTVSPSDTSIATGSNVQFRATGFFSNGSIQDMTASVAWSSSDAGIVTTNRVYAANSGSNTVSVIDTTSNAVVATIAVGTSPQGMALNPATNRLYVTNSGNGTLSVIDTGNNTVVATVAVGTGPEDVAVIP